MCLIYFFFFIYFVIFFFFFFFQAEDGIRDATVTGVQTCALPICRRNAFARDVATSNQSPSEFHSAPKTKICLRSPPRRRNAPPMRSGHRGTSPTVREGSAFTRR